MQAILGGSLIKFSNLFLLLAVLFISDNALAQIPTCPCDTATLSNGLTGNDIVELICPNGNLGDDSDSIIEPFVLGIFTDLPPKPDYFVSEGFQGTKTCVINADGVSNLSLELTDSEYNNCRRRLVEGCNLNFRPIPTLSEWGLITMAGLMGIVGFIVIRRRKVAA